jgi:tetratricopeptide (TPR) repeat protein
MGPVAAQDPAQAEAVQQALLRAFRGVEDPRAQGFADLDAVHAELERLAAEELAGLPEERRDQARFFVAVRAAEVRLRQGRLGEAAQLGLAARTAATAAGVWKGAYRALALVLLEQCAAEDERDALLGAEAGYLESGEAQRDAPWLEIPLALVRAELAFRDGRDAVGLRRLVAAADRALAELEAEDPRRVGALGRLGWELVLRGEFDRAEIYLKELPAAQARYPRGLVALRRDDHELALRAGRALERSGRAVDGLQLQGEALEAAGRLEDAQQVYQRLLALAEDPLARAIALRSLADTARGLGVGTGDPRLREAEGRYREALAACDELAAGGARHADVERVQILAALGETLEAGGALDAARAAFADSVARIDAVRRSLAVDPFGAAFLRDSHLAAIEGLLRLWPAERDVAEAFALVELGEARTLLDWTVAPPRTGGGLARAVRDLALSADPLALEARLDQLEAARRGEGMEARVSGAVPLDAARLRAALDGEPDTAFVSYWLGRRQLFVISRAGVRALAGSEAALAALGAARRAVLEVEADPRPVLEAAAAVFLPPALAAELEPAARVLICPGERLARLPFEALPLRGRALGLAKAVERAPSLSLRAVFGARAADPGGGVLLLTEVASAAAERELGLDPLAFSAREGDLVERAYGAGRVRRLRGPDASRVALEAALRAGRYDLLHVSAHAVEDRRLPTASLLVLADGPLALPSLCGLDLGGAFVVLSACSSATGEERGGEGDLGLLGWPVAAGARGALAALWPVGQQATADLMGQFHAERAAGVDEAEALRRARVALAGAAQYGHPFHWAGFAAFGPPRPGAGGGSGPALLVGLAALGLALWAAIARRCGGLNPRAAAGRRSSAAEER